MNTISYLPPVLFCNFCKLQRAAMYVLHQCQRGNEICSSAPSGRIPPQVSLFEECFQLIYYPLDYKIEMTVNSHVLTCITVSSRKPIINNNTTSHSPLWSWEFRSFKCHSLTGWHRIDIKMKKMLCFLLGGMLVTKKQCNEITVFTTHVLIFETDRVVLLLPDRVVSVGIKR